MAVSTEVEPGFAAPSGACPVALVRSPRQIRQVLRIIRHILCPVRFTLASSGRILRTI